MRADVLREERAAMLAREMGYLRKALAAGQADAGLYRRLAELADQSGDLAAAQSYLRRAKEQAQGRKARDQLALLDIRLLRLSRQSARADQVEARLHLAEAKAAHDQANLPAARAALDTAIALVDTARPVELYLLDAKLLESEGNPRAAEKVLRAGGKAYRENFWFPLRLARLAHARGTRKAALQHFDKARKLLQDTELKPPEFYLLGAEILSEVDRQEEALALLSQGAETHPENFWVLLRLTQVRHARGAVAEARTSLDQLIKAAPDKKTLWRELEISLLFEEQRWPEAIKSLEDARARGDLTLSDRIRLARAYSDKNDPEAEAACLLEVSGPAMLDTLFLRYVFWRHVKSASAELVDTVLTALRAEDRNELADELALVTYIQTMQYDLALIELRRRKMAQRNKTEALRLIQVLFGSHQYALGTRYARLCLRRWPEDPGIWTACIRTLMKLGALDQAAEMLAAAEGHLPPERIAQMRHLYCGYRADFEGATAAFGQLVEAGQRQESIRELQIKLMFNLMELESYDQVTERIGDPADWDSRPLHRRGLPGAFLIELALERAEAPTEGYASVEDWARQRPSSCVAATRLADAWWRSAPEPPEEPSEAPEPGPEPAPEPSSESAAASDVPPDAAAGPQAIPKQIFQYWDNPDLPGPVAHMVDSWRGVAGYSHELFNRRTAARFLQSAFGSKWSRGFALSRTAAGEADLLRLCVLAERGGVYADADDVLYGDLDALLSGAQGLVLYRETLGGALGNNFIAAPPKHPVLVAAAEMACRALWERSVEMAWTQTGPGLLTRAVAQYILEVGAEEARRHITVLDWPRYAGHVASHNPVSYKIKKGHWTADQTIIRPSEVWKALMAASEAAKRARPAAEVEHKRLDETAKRPPGSGPNPLYFQSDAGSSTQVNKSSSLHTKGLTVEPNLMMHCSICSRRGELVVEPGAAARDNLRCQNCRAMTRQRDVAQIIIDEFGYGQFSDLGRLVDSGAMDHLSVYEVGVVGPIARRLKNLPNYTQSYFWEDVELGTQVDGVDCQDLRALTYDDASFDLIVSLEVFEHVFEADKALREVARVLKPGGMHIFSIPVRYPFPDVSQKCAVLEDGEVRHLKEPRYHVAGDGSKSLVVTDWGRDFVDAHADAGLRLSVIRRSAPSVQALPNATFVARRMH